MNTFKRILLIEDDEDDQLFFKLAIELVDQSAEIFLAKNGEEGINMLMTMKALPNLVFLDLNMPLMNGYDCLTQIQETKLISHIPVIIFSTSNSEKDIAKADKLGAAGYLNKPNDHEILVNALTDIFSRFENNQDFF